MKLLRLPLLALLLPLLLTLAMDRGQKKEDRPWCDTYKPTVDRCCIVTKNRLGHTIECAEKKLRTVPIDIPEDTIKLDLKRNYISAIRNNSFQKNSRLTSLNLTSNRITTVEENAFNGLQNLTELFLTANRLTVLNSQILFPLKNLKILKIFMNSNISIRNDTFQYSRSLEILYAGSCGIRDISFLHSLKNSSNISRIFLDRNNLGSLRQDMFAGLVSKGLGLKLRGSNITDIENGTFSVIKNLTYLDLSNNDISTSLPGAVYGLHQLKELLINNVSLSDPNTLKLMWQYLRPNSSAESPLTSLYLTKNKLRKIQPNNFLGLGNLKHLILSDNPLTERISKDGLKGLTSLEEINLRHCTELTSFPKFAPDNYTANSSMSYTPKLRKLDLAWSPVVTLRKKEIFNGLESLKVLNLTHTFVRGLILDPLENLEKLYLSYCCLDELPNVTSNSLKQLYIRSNEFFLDYKMHQNWHIKYLEVLDIHGNKFHNMSGTDTINFFSIFPQLRTLKMGKMELYFLKDEIFDKMPNLEMLELSSNPLGSNMTARWFKNLTKLKHLEMQDCQITSITKKNFISNETFLKNLSLDLRQNPLSCDCNMDWLPYLINENILHLIGRPKDYTCKSPESLAQKHILISNFTLPEHCTFAYTLQVSLSISCICLLAMFFVGLALYSRYRWHIKYKLFKLKLWYYGGQNHELDGSNYKYDFYVHYDDDDVLWVTETLLPELEDKRGYRLYIKHRDSQLCEYIYENIRYSLDNSYKTVLCISNQFTKNAWSKFLLDLIIQKLVNEKKNILVCILLEEIEGQNLLETLENILTERSYIRLPEDRTPQAMEYFWTCLDAALRLPVIPHHSNASESEAADEQQPLLKNVC